MLDDNDLEFTALAWPNGGWILGILGVAVVVIMAIIVSGNHEECAKKHCDKGTPVLMENECLCVEKAQ